MPSQIWQVTLEADASSTERWFFRDQQDVQVEVSRTDTTAGVECKVQYTNSTPTGLFAVEIGAGEPPFYAAMTDLKVTARRKGGRKGELTATVKVTWPVAR
jgi:hypothetical protein